MQNEKQKLKSHCKTRFTLREVRGHTDSREVGVLTHDAEGAPACEVRVVSGFVGSGRTLRRSHGNGVWRFQCTILSQVTLALLDLRRQQVSLWLDMQAEREECAKALVLDHADGRLPDCLRGYMMKSRPPGIFGLHVALLRRALKIVQNGGPKIVGRGSVASGQANVLRYHEPVHRICTGPRSCDSELKRVGSTDGCGTTTWDTTVS